MIAAELDYNVPSIPMEDVNLFIEATKESYEKSLFFKEDLIYKERNSREYPWTRRVLEFNGNKIYPYDTRGAFVPFMDLINSLPVDHKTRTVILISQNEQTDYDFNFHFDGEIDYGFRICNGIDTTQPFLEFSQLKDEYVQHARDRKKIENNMVHEQLYSLTPKKSNTVLCINGHSFPHRVPINSAKNRFVIIVKGQISNLESQPYLQVLNPDDEKINLFQKLDFNNTSIDLEKIKDSDKKAYGNNFFEYSIADNEYLREVLDKIVEFTIPPDKINITEITYPGSMIHTDAWSVGLNYYFNAGEDETFYFDQIDNNILPRNVKDSGVKIYEIDNLKVKDRFIANKNEWYLINTSVPHAVRCRRPGTVRKMLRFIWYNHNLSTILNSLNIKN
jgi:hypothetical protein